MDKKILNKFQIEDNGDKIEVKVIQTDKGIKVDIAGQTMDVFINGESFYSKYDKEEYKYIPPVLRPFIEKHLCNYGEGIYKESGKVCCDITFDGTDYYVEISTARAKSNNITMRYWLTNYEAIEENKEITIPHGEEDYLIFLKKIEKYGYKMAFSHSGDDCDDWFDLVIPINDFDEERILECCKLWDEYNKKLNSFIG